MTPDAPLLAAVLFDHDGTLVDSEPVHHLHWQQVLGARGVTLTSAHYRDHCAGIPTPANAAHLADWFRLPDAPTDLAREKNEVTRDYLRQHAFPLMPGVRDAVETLHALGLRLGVVTGANAFGAQATLRHHGLTPYFSCMVSGDDVVRSKPAPDCYLLALAQLGLSAQACLAVEDTAHGLAAAHAAGLRCLAVPTPLSAQQDFAKASARLPSMEAALAYIVARL